MKFDSLADFINMGGHGVYVWTCFILVYLVLFLNWWMPLRTRKQWVENEMRRLRREESNQ